MCVRDIEQILTDTYRLERESDTWSTMEGSEAWVNFALLPLDPDTPVPDLLLGGRREKRGVSAV